MKPEDVKKMQADLRESLHVGDTFIFPNNAASCLVNCVSSYCDYDEYGDRDFDAIQRVIRNQITLGSVLLDPDALSYKIAHAVFRAWSDGLLRKNVGKQHPLLNRSKRK